jgi:hypothetical protein
MFLLDELARAFRTADSVSANLPILGSGPRRLSRTPKRAEMVLKSFAVDCPLGFLVTWRRFF